MINPPKTLAEARRYRYFEFADGYAFNPDCCAYAIGSGRYRGAQCSKRPSFGAGGLYCSGHAQKIEKSRPTDPPNKGR